MICLHFASDQLKIARVTTFANLFDTGLFKGSCVCYGNIGWRAEPKIKSDNMNFEVSVEEVSTHIGKLLLECGNLHLPFKHVKCRQNYV